MTSQPLFSYGLKENQKMSDIQDKAASTFSYIGAALSIISGLTLTEWGIIVGIVTALLTFGFDRMYKRHKLNLDKQYQAKHDARQQELHDLERRKLELEIKRLAQ